MADFQSAYSPAADSQQAYVDMGMGTVPTPTTGLTDKQKLLAAQMLQSITARTNQAPTAFAMTQAPRAPAYQPAPGYVNTMGGR